MKPFLVLIYPTVCPIVLLFHHCHSPTRKLCTCNGRTEAGHQMTSAGVWNGVFEGPQELLEVFTHCELIMIWLCVPSHFVEVNSWGSRQQDNTMWTHKPKGPHSPRTAHGCSYKKMLQSLTRNKEVDWEMQEIIEVFVFFKSRQHYFDQVRLVPTENVGQ